MARSYTGNTDTAGVTGARPGTRKFQDLLCFLNGMENWGIYANRNVRGSGSANPPKSVHATGRAMDTAGTAEQCRVLIDFLYLHRDSLMIEEIHDYRNNWIPGKGFGAGYRCNRDTGGDLSGWKVYTKNTIGSGGNWVHLEIAPAMADDPALVEKVFKDIFAGVVNQQTSTPAPKPESKPAPKAEPKPVATLTFAYPGSALRVGSSKTTAIRLVQAALKIPATGNFDVKTKRAVLAYQKEKGLVADGVVGPNTWASMFG